jgi:hypothetical protein
MRGVGDAQGISGQLYAQCLVDELESAKAKSAPNNDSVWEDTIKEIYNDRWKYE